jgi:hypothetical protein
MMLLAFKLETLVRIRPQHVILVHAAMATMVHVMIAMIVIFALVMSLHRHCNTSE